jgi:phosphoribosyl 1,2-cyclic phosphate phosphodiesterase
MLGQTEVVPLPVEHGKHETIGFMFVRGGRKLCAYMSDCKVVPPASRELMRGVDTLICDALRHTPHPTHMSFAEALELHQDIRPRQTWFTHIMCEIMHSREEPKLPNGVRIAYDGLKLDWNDQ